MIDSNVYSAGLGTATAAPVVGYSFVSKGQGGVTTQDAAAAADFERILNEAPPISFSPANPAPPSDEGEHSFLGFIKGIIDIINPLQHIPVIGAIYRHITGDEISPMARLAGDTLYGGPIGGAISMADIAYQKIMGQDSGATMIASLLDSHAAPAPVTMLARNFNDSVSPAAGHIGINDITWSEIPHKQDSPLSQAPTPTRTKGGEPVSHPTTAPPVYQTKGDAPAFQSLTASKADSTTTLQSQEAPAAVARTATLPESTVISKDQVPAMMMEALDKYAKMKRLPQAVTVSGLH